MWLSDNYINYQVGAAEYNDMTGTNLYWYTGITGKPRN